jgi:hypothetical protein
MNKQISAAQHADIVTKNHLENTLPWQKDYLVFAKPGETQKKAITRLMAGIRAQTKAKPKREFPKQAEALVSTKAYVEAYYEANFQDDYKHLNSNAALYTKQLFGDLSQARHHLARRHR